MGYEAVHSFGPVPGQPTPGKRELYAELQEWKGDVRVKLTRAKPKHTDPQRRYYWAAVATQGAACIREATGAECDKAAFHLSMKIRFLSIPIVHPDTGEEIGTFVRGSSSLDAAEYSQFTENVIGWLWDTFRVSVPSPTSAGVSPAFAATAAGK